MRAYLSYLLSDDSVVWPGEPKAQIRPFTTIPKDGYTSFKTLLPNHHGTHCDGPHHFNPDGPDLMDLPLEYFWFDHPVVVDVPRQQGDGIFPEDLKPYEDQIRQADLLLIKTGFCLLRDSQPDLYESHGPYLSPEVCRYLVETFPNLRTVGVDFLSVGTPANQCSREAHKTLFGCHNGKFLTAIEDMDFRPIFNTDHRLLQVIAAPLRLAGLDSSQVTVLAEFED